MNRVEQFITWLTRRTVARDLVAGVFTVTTLVVIVMGILNYLAVVRLAEAELKERLDRTAAVMIRRLADQMDQDQFDGAIAFMREAKKDLPETTLKLENDDGVIVFYHGQTNKDPGTDYLTLEKDIFKNEQFVGRLRIGFNSDRIGLIKQKMLKTTLLLMAILILALFLTIQLIVKRIFHRSLQPVQEGIRTFASGIYDHRMAPSRYHDIGMIIDEINSMAHFISNRTLQLQREISERKRTEVALTESRRKLMTLMENLPGMAYRCLNDKSYTMKFVSEGVKQLTGYTSEQVVDNRVFAFSSIIHDEDREKVMDSIDDALDENRAFEMEYRIVTAEGETKWVWEAGLGVVNVFGEVQALEGFIMDINSRRLAEEKLKQLNEELEMRVRERTADLVVTNNALKQSLKLIKETQGRLVESEKLAALGGMVAGMAHEINNPLGIGVTAASFMDGKLKDLQEKMISCSDQDAVCGVSDLLVNIQESSRIILANLRRASELVTGFKRVASDQSQGEHRTFNLRSYIEEIMLSLRPELKKKRIEIVLNISEELDIDSYPGVFSQIITNLVLNSLRHGFEDQNSGTIRIKVTQTFRHLGIEYSDDGQGMTPEIQAKVFDPFFTTKRGKGGSGLGLHIIFNLVTGTLKGEISCESSPGEGSRFIIRIPYIQFGQTTPNAQETEPHFPAMDTPENETLIKRMDDLPE